MPQQKGWVNLHVREDTKANVKLYAAALSKHMKKTVGMADAIDYLLTLGNLEIDPDFVAEDLGDDPLIVRLRPDQGPGVVMDTTLVTPVRRIVIELI